MGSVIGINIPFLARYVNRTLQAGCFGGAVMPNTSDTPEDAAYRKMRVYEAAVADAAALERDLSG